MKRKKANAREIIMEILILIIHVSFLFLSIYENKQAETVYFEAFAYFGILSCVGNEYLFLFIDFLQNLFLGLISLKNACTEKSKNKTVKLKVRNRADRTINSLNQNRNTSNFVTENRLHKNSSGNKSIMNRKQIIQNNNYIQGFQSISSGKNNNPKLNSPEKYFKIIKLNPPQPFFSNPNSNFNFSVNNIKNANDFEKNQQAIMNPQIFSNKPQFLKNILDEIKKGPIQNSPVILNEFKFINTAQNSVNANPFNPNIASALNVSKGSVIYRNEFNQDEGRTKDDLLLPGQTNPSSNLSANPSVNDSKTQKQYNPWNKINDPIEISKLN